MLSREYVHINTPTLLYDLLLLLLLLLLSQARQRGKEPGSTRSTDPHTARPDEKKKNKRKKDEKRKD